MDFPIVFISILVHVIRRNKMGKGGWCNTFCNQTKKPKKIDYNWAKALKFSITAALMVYNVELLGNGYETKAATRKIRISLQILFDFVF